MGFTPNKARPRTSDYLTGSDILIALAILAIFFLAYHLHGYLVAEARTAQEKPALPPIGYEVPMAYGQLLPPGTTLILDATGVASFYQMKYTTKAAGVYPHHTRKIRVTIHVLPEPFDPEAGGWTLTNPSILQPSTTAKPD